MSRQARRGRSSPLASDGRYIDNSDEWKTLFHDSTENAGDRSLVRFDRQGTTSKAPDLYLDLFNFEEPGSQQSRYVLTSPRSLEACGRFGIKPVELLHKTFEEFVEEFKSLYDTDYSHQAVYEVFQEHERQRLRKLKLCRDERERIVRENGGETNLYNEDDVRGMSASTLRMHSSKSPTRSPDFEYKKESSFAKRKTKYLKEAEKDNRWMSFSSETDKYKRATGLFHDQGKENLHMMDRKETRITERPPSGKTKHSYAGMKSRSISPRETKTYGESSDSEGGGNTFTTGTRATRGSWSTSGSEHAEYSPRTSKKPSSAGSFGKRGRLIKRTMSVDSIDSLGAAGKAGLSDKDQRIVNLMVSRHAEQERSRKERLMLDLEWDEQRKLEEQLRQARHRQRQAEIYDRYKAKDVKQFEVRARRLRNEQRLRKDKEEMLMSKDFAWQMERRKQEQIKGNKMQTKKLKDTEAKRRQEENLWQKKREDEMNRNMVQLNLLDKHKTAITKKNHQCSQDRMRIGHRNKTVQEKHSYSRKQVGQQLREQEDNVRHEVAVKHHAALVNYQRQLSRKENQLTMNKIKREERVERQQEQLKKKRDDMEEWQKELTVFRKQKEKRAQDTVTTTVASKQHRVKAHLIAKTEDHLHNFERVKQADEERKRNIQEIIEIKDDRSKMVNTEKDEIRRLNRDAARTSQAVRDIVREQTLRSSFDKMAEAAQRQALVGRGPQTGNKNRSSFKLGY